ncbi:MAG: hypothetical protein ABT940_13785, partial [Alphaproteobacteria bacterium]
MALRETLSALWHTIQTELFPWLEDDLGPLSQNHQRLVVVLELANIEGFVRHWRGVPGRPPAEPAAWPCQHHFHRNLH